MSQLDVASPHSMEECLTALNQQKRTQLLRESSASKPSTRPRPASWGFVFCAFVCAGLLRQIIELLPPSRRAATATQPLSVQHAIPNATFYVALNLIQH